MTVRTDLRALVESGDLTPQQRVLVGDALLAAEVLAELEPTDYSAQDAALVVLRETWKRLEEALPGATSVFPAQGG